MATTSNMFLYSLTIQPPSHVVQVVLGQFGNTKEQLIVTAAGSQLTLLRPDPTVGKVHTVLTHDVFGIVRSLAACRVFGSSKGELIPEPRVLGRPRQSTRDAARVAMFGLLVIICSG